MFITKTMEVAKMMLIVKPTQIVCKDDAYCINNKDYKYDVYYRGF